MIYDVTHRDQDSDLPLGYLEGPDDADLTALYTEFRHSCGVLVLDPYGDPCGRPLRSPGSRYVSTMESLVAHGLARRLTPEEDPYGHGWEPENAEQCFVPWLIREKVFTPFPVTEFATPWHRFEHDEDEDEVTP